MSRIIQTRPTGREIHKRLEEAKLCLKLQPGYYANQAKAAGELNDLDLLTPNEIWALIRDLLEEISVEDYVGARPPQEAYEKTIEGKELYAFSWWSQKMGKKMYVKFALHQNRYYYVSLHESRSTIMRVL